MLKVSESTIRNKNRNANSNNNNNDDDDKDEENGKNEDNEENEENEENEDNEENEENEENEFLLSNPRKKKKIEKIKNNENILFDSNNKNEKMNLETKKGILPKFMLLRQICDFPDLNFENENFIIEESKEEGKKLLNNGNTVDDFNEYGCAIVDNQNSDDNNNSNNDSNYDFNNQAGRIQKEKEIFVSILLKNSNKLKVKSSHKF